MKRNKFKYLEAIVFNPDFEVEKYPKYPLKRNEVVYFLGDIPNVHGHCVVVRSNGKTVPMVHPEDFRKAKEKEL